jgi:hypothetical protein
MEFGTPNRHQTVHNRIATKVFRYRVFSSTIPNQQPFPGGCKYDRLSPSTNTSRCPPTISSTLSLPLTAELSPSSSRRSMLPPTASPPRLENGASSDQNRNPSAAPLAARFAFPNQPSASQAPTVTDNARLALIFNGPFPQLQRITCELVSPKSDYGAGRLGRVLVFERGTWLRLRIGTSSWMTMTT